MPKFVYKVKDGPKNVLAGSIDAENRTAAIDKLMRAGYYPLEVVEETAPAEKPGAVSFYMLRRIRTIDLAMFTRQLSDLLGSGLTLLNALGVLASQTENRRLERVILKVRDSVKDGVSLSDALTAHPKVFSNFYTSIVRSGEVGGALEAVLTRLADFAEREEEIRSKIRTSLAYPALICLVGAATIIVLLTFVIPKMVAIFVDLGQELPLPTRILIGASGFVTRFWWIIVAVILLGYFLTRRRRKASEGRLAMDKMKLKIPVLGELFMKSEIARFSRSLGTLLANGIPILHALEVVAQTMKNEVLRREVETMQKDVRDGAALAASIKKSPYIPPFVVNMIAVGEESGLLEKSLSKVADSYEKETDRVIKVMTSLLEPIMILVMGAIVGFIVVSMLLPIFQINILVR